MNKQTMPEVGMILYSRGHDKHTAQVGVVVEILPNSKFKVDWDWLCPNTVYPSSTYRWLRTYDFKAFPSFTVRGKIEGAEDWQAATKLAEGLKKVLG